MKIEDINVLYIEYKNGKSISKIAKENNISRQWLTNLFIKYCDYKPRARRQYKNLVNEYYVDLYYKEFLSTNISQTEFCKKYSLCRQYLGERFKEKYPNVKTRKGNKYSINSNSFANINHYSAYWLGMLLTDGYLNKENEISLCLKDKEHIEKFKSFLKSNHKICTKTINLNNKKYYAYSLSFKDTIIYKDLNKLGCYNNKSFTVRLPLLEELYMPDLIRGIFDGDGSTTNKSNTTSNSINIVSANIDFLNDIRSVLEKNLIIVNGINKSRNLYNLRISVKKENLKRFFNYIYKNSDTSNRLNRKYNSIIKMLN